jgi:hypothetical protein
MPGSEFNFLKQLADFLKEYGVHAFASISLFVNAYLFRELRSSDREKFNLALSIAPLAEAMTALVQSAAKARARKSSPTPSPGV